MTQLNANISIQADPNQIKQALLNLILNAIDAMPNGGTLTIAQPSIFTVIVQIKKNCHPRMSFCRGSKILYH